MLELYWYSKGPRHFGCSFVKLPVVTGFTYIVINLMLIRKHLIAPIIKSICTSSGKILTYIFSLSTPFTLISHAIFTDDKTLFAVIPKPLSSTCFRCISNPVDKAIMAFMVHSDLPVSIRVLYFLSSSSISLASFSMPVSLFSTQQVCFFSHFGY